MGRPGPSQRHLGQRGGVRPATWRTGRRRSLGQALGEVATRPVQKTKSSKIPVPMEFSNTFWFQINLRKKQGGVIKTSEALDLALRRLSLHNLQSLISQKAV